MKICIVRHGYFPEDVTVKKEAFALIKAGHSVDIICLRLTGQPLHENINGVMIYRNPLEHKRGSAIRYLIVYSMSFIALSLTLLYQYTKRRYDCIQVVTMPDFLIFATIIPKIFGAKIMLQLNEPTPELFITKNGQMRYHFLLFLQIKLEQLAIRFADHSLTPSDILRKRFGERGADLERISVIPNVFDENSFTKDLFFVPPVSNGEFKLIAHGLVAKRNGYDVLIRSLPLLRNDIHNLRLFIIGEGESLEDVKEIARELNCSDIVTFTGRIPSSQVRNWIDLSDLGIIPLLSTPFGELCQPIRMFEYIACRKPVLVPKLKAIEELLDNSSAIFYNPGDHHDLARGILEIYQNPVKGKNLADKAFHIYKNLCWQKTKMKYLNLMEDLKKHKKI